MCTWRPGVCEGILGETWSLESSQVGAYGLGRVGGCSRRVSFQILIWEAFQEKFKCPRISLSWECWIGQTMCFFSMFSRDSWVLWEPPARGWFPRSTRPQSPTSRSTQQGPVVLGALSSPLLPGLHQGTPLASQPCPNCSPAWHTLPTGILTLPTLPLGLSAQTQFPQSTPHTRSKGHALAPRSPARCFSSPELFTPTFYGPACHPLDNAHSFRCDISAIRTCLTIDRMS